jgi:serine/threonine protein kinase
MSITDPLIGSQLGDYRVMDILGRGGMARVYKGYDAKLERNAAVKVIDAHLTNENEDEYRQRFLREARSIARLNHPRIVGVYQFGQVDTVYYMAMAFIEGRDLGQLLKEAAHQGRLMTYGEIMRIMRDISGALDHAHREGVIHRDVKPSNIMVTSDGHAVLTDFGLALSVPEGSIGNTFGSAHYIAPEQAISSANAVPQSDFYSLGVVLYQMLVGKVPFDDPSAMSVALKHLSDPPPPPRVFNPNLSLEVEAIVLRMLEKDPSKRFADGEAVIAALESAVGMEDERATASSPSKTSEMRKAALAAAVPVAPVVAPVVPAAPTNPDLEKSRPAAISQLKRPATLPKPPVKERSRAPLFMGIAVIAIIVLVGAFAVLSGANTPPATPTPPATGTAVAAAAVVTDETTEEATVRSTEAVGAASTDDATQEAAASTEEPTATRRPTRAATPTDEPTRTPRPTNTPARSTATERADIAVTDEATEVATEEATPEVTDTSSSGTSIDLIYDDASLVLMNRSGNRLDVSNLQFIQTPGTGNPLTFGSNQWQDAQRLPNNSCLQVWRNDGGNLDVPTYCEDRRSWRAVSFVRWFWVSSADGATFEVRRGSEVLATCEISAGECVVELGADSKH